MEFVSWDDSSQYMEKIKMFQTTNQYITSITCYCFISGISSPVSTKIQAAGALWATSPAQDHLQIAMLL